MWIMYVDASLSSEGDKIGQKGQKWTEMKGIWSQSAAGSRCALLSTFPWRILHLRRSVGEKCCPALSPLLFPSRSGYSCVKPVLQPSRTRNIYPARTLKLFLSVSASEPPKARNSITSFITLIFL